MSGAEARRFATHAAGAVGGAGVREQYSTNLKTQPRAPAAQETVEKFKIYMETANKLGPEWNTRWNEAVKR